MIGGGGPALMANADDGDEPTALAQVCPRNWPTCAPGTGLFNSDRRDAPIRSGPSFHAPRVRLEEQRSPRRSVAKPKAKIGATYRTWCVRTCDGYYWPMSFATTKAYFEKDAEKCEASCSGEVKLFVHRNPGETPEEMVDLEGNRYADLDNAFIYRVRLIDGCACKPPPWSEEERQRHAAYAEEEEEEKEAQQKKKKADASKKQRSSAASAGRTQ